MKRSLAVFLLALLVLPLAVVAQQDPPPASPVTGEMTGVEALGQFPTQVLADRYGNRTILVVYSMENITVLESEDVDVFEDPPPPADPAVEPTPLTDPVDDPLVDAEITLTDVTGDSEAYYGREVTVDAELDEFINVRSFLIGASGFLTRPQLLVVNATNESFPLDVVVGSRVRVTGVVYPHFDEGGWDMLLADAPGRTAPTQPDVQTPVGTPTPDDMATPDDVTTPEAVDTPDDATTPEAVETPGDEDAGDTDAGDTDG